MPSVYTVPGDISYWKDETISISKALKIKTSRTQRQTSTIFSKMFRVMCYSIQYFAELHNKGLEAPFEACYITMKDKKPYTTGPLFIPAVVKIFEITHGKQYGDKVKCIPLTANTAGKHIENTARDLKKQAVEQILRCGKFAVWQKEKYRCFSHVSAYDTC